MDLATCEKTETYLELVEKPFNFERVSIPNNEKGNIEPESQVMKMTQQ